MPRRPPPTFGAAPVVESRSAQLRQDTSLAGLAKTYADIDAERRRVALLEAELARKPPVQNVAQKLREQNVLGRGKAVTEAAANAFTALPKVEDQARIALQRGKSLVEHPGFEAAVGRPNPLKGGFGVGEFFGDARDFSSELEKSQAGAFLTAFEQLKGAGAITEREGEAATKALANLKTSVSEAQFKKNLQEYMDIVAQGVTRLRGTSQLQPIPYSVDLLKAEKARRAAARRGQ